MKLKSITRACSDSVFSDYLEPDEMRSLIAGLDAFYDDNTIRYLPISCALIATVMIQQNLPKAEIDAYIRDSKKWTNDLMDEIIRE
ncbi:MAG: hypothetical protein L6422_07265 [Candidatus Marinimicrobia bacterium]|nr:hypothetical protein [bacterium]MCG2716068.1 hypothetical protein [Candidatus Neomarinimicrobiota bacterium]